MNEADPFDLGRFAAAQDGGGTYERAVAELRRGRKAGHWMWFVFPQIAGLGFSATSRRYAIRSMAEARAYLAHPVLGPRLIECALIIAAAQGHTAEEIFGATDAIKLRSSMSLFSRADPAQPLFREVLRQYFADQPDQLTDDAILAAGEGDFAGR